MIEPVQRVWEWVVDLMAHSTVDNVPWNYY